jgi:hypothetical protein
MIKHCLKHRYIKIKGKRKLMKKKFFSLDDIRKQLLKQKKEFKYNILIIKSSSIITFFILM